MFRMTRSRLLWLSCGSLVALVVGTLVFAWTQGAAAQGRSTPPIPIAVGQAPTDGPVEPELPNYDAFTSSEAAKAGRARQPQAPQFEGGRLVQMEPLLDIPTVLWTNEALSPNAHLGVPVRLRYSRTSIESAARQHLKRYASRYRLTDQDVNGAAISSVHDTGHGAIIVKFKQAFDGVEVFREQLAVVMNRQLDVVAFTGYVTGAAEAKAGSLKFALPPSKAIAVALSDLTSAPVEAAELRPDTTMLRARRDTPYEYFQARPTARLSTKLAQPVRSKKVLYHMVGQVVPAYYLEADVVATDNNTNSRYYAYVISAADGQLLYRKNLTANDVYTYRVWADPVSKFPADGPQQDFTPHPTGVPDGSQPPFAPPSLVALQNFPFSQNDPWLPAGATETTGNNVDAYADHNAPDGLTAGDFRATTTALGVFDRTYDTTLAPSGNQDQTMAAITHLFYVNNFLHDWFYDHGFNEAAGNAQDNNFGRGGLGGDSLKAEAQDTNGGNLNNANMSTPADGARPRMQMYLWSGPSSQSLTVNGGPLAGTYVVGTASFGPTNFTLTGNLVVAIDAVGDTEDGCTALTNAGAIAGNIALIRRGTCNFTVKAANAQAAGAIGVIISNNVAGVAPGLGGADPTITIPVLSVSQADGNTLRTQLALPATVNVTMTRTTGVMRDGTIDSQIIAHEWGHYIHHRLTNTGNNQGGSMSEGWGDFTGMLLTVREGDNYDGVYAQVGYPAGGQNANSHYFGLRRYPYSTDMTKNPLTFKHIADGVALPVGPPIGGGGPNSEVHNSGEIWATVLWECYAALLKDNTRGLTFKQKQDRMLSYVVTGYKLTPPDATYTEGRDAILLAAFINDPADFQLFTQAFAKRGMGCSAVSPARFSTNHAGVVEDFTLTCAKLTYLSAVLNDNVSSCDNDGVLDNGETGSLTISLQNTGWSTLGGTTATISSPTPGVTFPNGPTINFPASTFGTTTAGNVNVQVSGLVGIQVLTFNIAYNDPSLTPAGPLNAIYQVQANSDIALNSSKSDDVESPISVWTASHNTGLGNLADWTRVQASGANHLWLGPDVGGISDHYLTSPALQVAPSGNFVLTFAHRYQFEADATLWDGGVIEISTDNGASWNDIGNLIGGADGYDGVITDTSGNPLANRMAFSGQNDTYPNFQTVTLNLGATYAGQTVRIRFRIGTDAAAGAAGWEIDDIAFTGITNTPFAQVVAETTVPGGTLGPASGALPTGVTGVAYSQQFLVNNAISNSITLANGSSLPPGLNLSGTGLLAGTPTTPGSFTFTLQSPNGCGIPTPAVYTLQINCGAFAITPAALPTATAGVLYNQALNVTPNVGGPHSFAVTGGALPQGMSLSAQGVLSGTAAATGTFNFTVTVTGFGGACSTAVPLSLTVVCPTVTLPASLANGVAGTAYNQSVAASPAGGNYTYAVTTNVLPPGLTLNNATGAITGTPNAAGNYAFGITATGWGTCTKTQSYNVLITGTCAAITLTPATLPGGTIGTTYPLQTLTATGGTAPYTFAVSSGALPAGLALSSSGELTGTPTAGGSFSFTVRATSQSGCTGQRTYVVSITCGALTFAPTTLGNGTKGVAYNQQLSVSPGSGATFSVLLGSLPPGFTLSSSGLLSGTTTQANTYNFTVKAVVGTCQGTKAYTLVINNGASAALAQNGDYDGDGKSDPALWSAQDGTWRIVKSSTEQVVQQIWGTAGDVALLGDYDGDGLSDLAVYRPIQGTWYVKRSRMGDYFVKAWGLMTDVPVPGDYDGDGKTDLAVWRGSEGQWYVLRSSDGQAEITAWGADYAPYLDVPVPGDYDGDGKTDVAVFRRSTGTWLVKRSSDGQYIVKQWGLGTDVPVVNDYDGDGKVDLAVWRGSNGTWYIQTSANGAARTAVWGAGVAPYHDQAVPGDYDGDGQADLAVWRAPDATWYLSLSGISQNSATRMVKLGESGDKPIGTQVR